MTRDALKQELYNIIDVWKSESEKRLEVGDKSGMQSYEKDLHEEVDTLCDRSVEYYQKVISNINKARHAAKKNISTELVIKDGCVTEHVAKTDINLVI